MNNNTPHKPRKSRHAKRHAAEQTEPFGFDELETRSQEFRNDRRLRGAQQANADWVAEPLDEWLSCLDAGNTDLGRETMAAFAAVAPSHGLWNSRRDRIWRVREHEWASC